MAVRLITDAQEFTGLTVDTAAWLAANTDLPDGSTYRELDGTQRIYKIQDGTWRKSSKEESYLDYELLPYRVFAVGKGGVIFASDVATYKVYKSTDGGATWTGPLATLPAPAYVGAITDSGKVVAITTNNKVMYSANGGISFTEVLTGINYPLTHGIDVNVETIMFAEYTILSATLHVYRSTDGGATWASVFSKVAPDEVRHFHTLKHFREYNLWYLTSGDTDVQTKWWTSVNGDTWAEITGCTGMVPFRTVGLANTAPDTLLWAIDHDKSTFIYAANRNNIAKTYRRVGIIPGHGMGIAGAKDLLVTAARIEDTDPKGTTLNPVYVSSDGGLTWCREGGMTAQTYAQGFEGVLGPDKWGNFYFQYYKIEESPNVFATVRGTPNKGMHFSGSPIKNTMMPKPFVKEIVNEDIRNTTARIIYMSQTLAFSDLYNPQIAVYNSLDQAVTLKIGIYNNLISKLSDGTLLSITLAANKSFMITAADMQLGNILPATAYLVFTPSGTPTTGALKAELHGLQYEYEDMRMLS